MPPIRKNPLNIRTRLNQADHLRFQQTAKAMGLTETALARQAILDFLDTVANGEIERRESLYAQVSKANTNRTCSLIAKVALDVRALYMYLGERNPQALEEYRARARKVISKSLEPPDAALRDSMNKFVQTEL